MHMIEHARFLPRDTAGRLELSSQKKSSVGNRFRQIRDRFFLKKKVLHHEKIHQDLFVQLPLTLVYSRFSTKPIRLPRSPLGPTIILNKEQQGTIDSTKPLMKFGDIFAGPPPENFHPPGLPEHRSTNGTQQLTLPYLDPSLLPKRI